MHTASRILVIPLAAAAVSSPAYAIAYLTVRRLSS